MSFFLKITKVIIAFFAVLLLGPLAKSFQIDAKGSYSPQHIPHLSAFKEKTVVEVYGAGAGKWQGIFSLHTWIAIKRRGDETFTIYEVLRERPPQGLSAIYSWEGNPDRPWSGNYPKVIFHREGDDLLPVIDKIEAVIRGYQHNNLYILWPGPNCNTFTASIARGVPELGIALPVNAIGKDFLSLTTFLANAPSGTGMQFSFFGFLGMTIAKIEGVELNFLGLNFGYQPHTSTILFPGVGKIELSTTE